MAFAYTYTWINELLNEVEQVYNVKGAGCLYGGERNRAGSPLALARSNNITNHNIIYCNQYSSSVYMGPGWKFSI